MLVRFFFFVVVAFAAVADVTYAAQKGRRDGSCGDNVSWSVSGTTLTISGNGYMDNFTREKGVPWKEERDSIESVVIEEGVKSIGDYAFYYSSSLEIVTIPSSVIWISNSAFQDCRSMTVFSVHTDNPKFSSSDDVLFNKGRTTLIQYPLGKSRSTKSYTIPNGVVVVGRSAFSDSSLETVTFSSTVTSIEDDAFYFCGQLKSITLSQNLKSIGSHVFTMCNSLQKIILPDSLVSIGDLAFYCCYGLSSISIPSKVEFIGNGAFFQCSALTSISVNASNEYYSSMSGVLFNKDGSKLIQYPPERSGVSYTIPSDVKNIEERAFSNCDNLEKVSLPSTMTSIGEYAFYQCSSLKEISLPSGVTSIGNSSFELCSSLTKVVFSDNLISIGKDAFNYCESLESVVIPSKVTSIGDSAFFGCKSLKSVVIPSSVLSMDGAFAYCGSLLSIEVDNDNSIYSSVDGVLFDRQLKTLILYPPGRSDTKYIVPDGVNTIASGAFSYCKKLNYVDFPKTVTSIESHAFSQCTGLKSIVIPDSVTSFGIGIFLFCSNLENATLPDSITSIENSTFYQCGKLTHFSIPENVTIIKDSAFCSCSKLSSITIPDKVRIIGGQAFSFCSSLETITIPDSVVSVGSQAFSECGKLESVFYQGSTVFSSEIFSRYNSVKTVCVSPDYQSSTFCGKPVNSSAPLCQQFLTLFNHCYKADYVDGEFIQVPRKNATEFEGESGECAEYHCNNESGRLGWSLCNSSDEVSRVCLDSQCVDKQTIEENRWRVELGMEGVSVAAVTENEVRMVVHALTGIQDISIAYEVDDTGFVFRVVVFVGDESTAKALASTVETLGKGDECLYGVLCEVKSVNILGGPWSVLSGSRRISGSMIMLVAMVVISCFV